MLPMLWITLYQWCIILCLILVSLVVIFFFCPFPHSKNAFTTFTTIVTIVSILKLCFSKLLHHNKGSRELCWYAFTQALLLKTTGADDACSLGGNENYPFVVGSKWQSLTLLIGSVIALVLLFDSHLKIALSAFVVCSPVLLHLDDYGLVLNDQQRTRNSQGGLGLGGMHGSGGNWWCSIFQGESVHQGEPLLYTFPSGSNPFPSTFIYTPWD